MGSRCEKIWNTIKGLNNKPVQPDNQGIRFNGKMTNNARTMAKNFNTHYTPSSNTKPAQALRRTLHNIKKKSRDNKVKFSPAQILAAIKKAKSSKALGPDGLSPIMLKYIRPKDILFLTNIFNLSLKNTHIPSIWISGKIIPLLKPWKPADQGKNYRPVSLLCPASKIFEALLLPQVNEAVNLANHQHGFRKGRSTTTALTPSTTSSPLHWSKRERNLLNTLYLLQ